MGSGQNNRQGQGAIWNEYTSGLFIHWIWKAGF